MLIKCIYIICVHHEHINCIYKGQWLQLASWLYAFRTDIFLVQCYIISFLDALSPCVYYLHTSSYTIRDVDPIRLSECCAVFVNKDTLVRLHGGMKHRWLIMAVSSLLLSVIILWAILRWEVYVPFIICAV